MIELKDVAIALDGGGVLSGLSFVAGQGKILCLAGRHGCGKSNVIDAIAGLAPVRSGYITFDGELLTPTSAPYFRNDMAYMPQHFDVKTVKVAELFYFFDAVTIGGKQRLSRRKLMDLWDMFSLDHALIDRRCDELSAAELQVVLLTMACLPEKKHVVVDEPAACLDDEGAKMVGELLRRKADEGATVVVATADTALTEVADEIVDLQKFKQ